MKNRETTARINKSFSDLFHFIFAENPSQKEGIILLLPLHIHFHLVLN